jgi:sulfoxide reductase heme-binding subunit YedZ
LEAGAAANGVVKRVLLSSWTKALVFALCLVPLVDLLWRAYRQDLTANPVEFITHTTGDWTIRFLMITLSVTPLRLWLRQPLLVRFRRMFGLFSFFYAMLHFAAWFCIDKFFDFQEMGKDILKRPFITIGMAALLMLAPLAVTSTGGWVRRLGYRRWRKLHRLVYAIALCGVIHYYWLVKSDVRLPLLYGAIWVTLMTARLIEWRRRRLPAPATSK